jgi:two-component system capsular synthesis sensor histidine kinase RcsC
MSPGADKEPVVAGGIACTRSQPVSETSRGRVLVIDDDSEIRVVLADLLRLLGYEADVAADGAAGLELFERGEYTVVLTDLIMPGMNGWQVADAVRRRDNQIAVIMVSGSLAAGDQDRGRATNVVLLEKPVTLRTLRAALSDALRPPSDSC